MTMNEAMDEFDRLLNEGVGTCEAIRLVCQRFPESAADVHSRVASRNRDFLGVDSSVLTGDCDTTDATPARSWTGVTFEDYKNNNYRIVREIGEGGMSRVLLAERSTCCPEQGGDHVAIKIPKNKCDGRFLEEYRIQSDLSHDNIVKIFAKGDYPMRFLVMGYVDGDNLDRICDRADTRESKVFVTRVHSWMIHAAEALDYIHQKGYVHRDVKPNNILIDRRDDKAWLIDFGIARDLASSSQLTTPGSLVGTLAYMSPELRALEKPSEADDIYSFGVTFYKVLTGKLPADASPSPKDVNPVVPDDLAELVVTCLAARANRFSTAAPLLSELKTIARSMHPLPHQNVPTRRAVVAIAAVLGLIGITTYAVQSRFLRYVRNKAASQPKSANIGTIMADIRGSNSLYNYLYLLEGSEDNTLRTSMIHSFAKEDVPVECIVHGLTATKSPTVLAALLQGLQEYYAKVPDEEVAEIVVRQFESHSHPAVHSTCEWLFRCWNRTDVVRNLVVKAIPENGSIGWYNTRFGHVFSVIPYGESLREKNRQMIAIGTCEVSNQQYYDVRNEFSKTKRQVESDRLDFPIDCVTWHQAAGYCVWLSQMEGIPKEHWCYREIDTTRGVYEAVENAVLRTGYRLPTSAEWEYACRAGSTTAWFFGGDRTFLSEYAQVNPHATYPRRCGLLKPNDFGLFDTYGNLAEWCHDKLNPSSTERIVRGGSCFRPPNTIDSSGLSHKDQDLGNASILRKLSFRVARTLSGIV